MRLKSLLQVMGFRGKPRHYGYEMYDYPVGEGRVVHYAHWLHPHEKKKVITAEAVEAYAELMDEGDFCIDIGAHAGDSTLPMALAAGPTGCVLALEPNPYVYHVLEKNARANAHLANIRPLMAASVPEPGFVEFEYSDAGFCNGGRHEGISAWRHGHAFKLSVFGVDLMHELQTDYADRLPKLRLIKVDSEGYDLYILRSLAGLIDAHRPIVKAEVFKDTDTAYRRDLLAFFIDRGYRVYKIDEDPITPGPVLNPDTVDNWRHYDILCRP